MDSERSAPTKLAKDNNGPSWQVQKKWATPYHGKDGELRGQAPYKMNTAWDPRTLLPRDML